MRAVIAMAPVLMSVLAMAACGETTNAPVAAPADVAGPEIAGVKLDQSVRALGTEPFWSVDIETSGLAYKPMDGETFTVAHDGPEITGNVAVWNGKDAEGQTMVVTLTGTDCSDGMSDRTYPLTARVEIGQRVLVGCAASSEALQRASESGRVE